MAKEYETADVGAPLSLIDCTAIDIWNTAADVPHFLRHPANCLEFQTWPKDSCRFRAACTCRPIRATPHAIPSAKKPADAGLCVRQLLALIGDGSDADDVLSYFREMWPEVEGADRPSVSVSPATGKARQSVPAIDKSYCYAVASAA